MTAPAGTTLRRTRCWKRCTHAVRKVWGVGSVAAQSLCSISTRSCSLVSRPWPQNPRVPPRGPRRLHELRSSSSSSTGTSRDANLRLLEPFVPCNRPPSLLRRSRGASGRKAAPGCSAMLNNTPEHPQSSLVHCGPRAVTLPMLYHVVRLLVLSCVE